jgi:DNA-binding transcriptional LysR family regulator
MPSLRQIRYFIAAAETNKINSASATLGISQSSVTTAIQQLEAELGVPLFTRKPSGISLTIEGARFLNHARNIEATVSDAVRSMRNGINRIKGQLRVGLTYAASGYFILPLLARFRRAFDAACGSQVAIRFSAGRRSRSRRSQTSRMSS